MFNKNKFKRKYYLITIILLSITIITIRFNQIEKFFTSLFFSEKPLEYRTIPEDIMTILENYPEIKRLTAQADIELPIPKNMVPQGITLLDDEYIIVSAYNTDHSKKSKSYVLSSYGQLFNTVTLDNRSHVGGIAYDKKNDLLWLPDNDGSLNAYEASQFIDQKDIKPKYTFDKIGLELKKHVYKNQDFIDYLSVDGKYLYIGGFSLYGSGLVKKYEIIKKGSNLELEYKNSFKIPSKIQGITFYHKNDKVYMILSQSFGRQNVSHIIIFEYDETETDYNEARSMLTLESPPLLEQVTSVNSGLYMIFESGANKYSDCKEKIENVLILDLEQAIKEP